VQSIGLVELVLFLLTFKTDGADWKFSSQTFFEIVNFHFSSNICRLRNILFQIVTRVVFRGHFTVHSESIVLLCVVLSSSATWTT
jgi:hypothetical protein